MQRVLRLLVLCVFLGGSVPSALTGVTRGYIGVTQEPDPGFNANVARPAYARIHPRVLFDEAHNNTDTAGGRYKPFSDLITNDGYKVTPNTRSFTPVALKSHQILVIVNPSGPQSQRGASPFTEQECEAVREWVNLGGALLLIADHLPFSSAIAGLAAKLDLDFTRGYTIDSGNKESEDQSELIFSRENGLIGDHPITLGRDETERINRIVSFSGTSLKGPQTGVQFLKLAPSAMDVLPPAERKPLKPGEAEPDHKQVSAAGRAQGVALEVGKGRIVVLGEAAMLTALITPRGFRYGMNTAGSDNRQLALNIMHWLSRLLK